MKKIKIGVIGLGQRGRGLLGTFLGMEDVEVVAVCDEYQDRVDEMVEKIKDRRGNDAFGTTNYKELLAKDDVEAVCIACSWEMHVPIAIDAMEAGKAVGMEVGGAYSVDDCYRLVKANEKSGVFFMMLENCCYGRTELLALEMVKEGVFGEIVHCAGCYSHDLRGEISQGEKIRHYRLRNYIDRCCENYPTHEFGPIAKILNINNGNRLVSLASFSSNAAGLNEYNKRLHGEDHVLAKTKFNQGDIVTTLIKCSNGETILLTLDTTLPIPYYSRGLTVRGTKGMFKEDTNSVVVEKEVSDELDPQRDPVKENIEEYYEKYDSPIWAEYYKSGVTAGHGGMDWHVLRAFVEGFKDGHQSPINVYDAAVWMSITALSEQSIARGGALVDVPDFTGGKWVKTTEKEVWKYSL